MKHSRRHTDSSSSICVGTGLVALDYVINSAVKRQPLEWAGGSCGNVLTILSFLGWQAIPIARLGNDLARKRIVADVSSFGVNTEYLLSDSTVESPIIFEFIREGKHGTPTHRFDLRCPYCGSMLPRFRPITRETAKTITAEICKAEVFYFDRVSPGALLLADHFRRLGSLVFFEPTSIGDPRLFDRALAVSHVVKFSAHQLNTWEPIEKSEGPTVVVATQGAKGVDFCLRRSNGKLSSWKHMNGFVVRKLVDAAGAGDWCSAGFIKLIAPHWVQQPGVLTEPAISNALRYGQALSALNCQFEGARGTMYALEPDKFERAVKAVLSAVDPKVEQRRKPFKSNGVNACPHCRQRLATGRIR